MFANTELEKFITHILCQKGVLTQPLCQLIVSMIGGFSIGETDYVSYRRNNCTNRIELNVTIHLYEMTLFSGALGGLSAICTSGMLVQAIDSLCIGHSKSRYQVFRIRFFKLWICGITNFFSFKYRE